MGEGLEAKPAHVRKADKAGWIKRLADGTIDPEASARLWDANSDPVRTQVRTEPAACVPAPRCAPEPARCAPDAQLAAEAEPVAPRTVDEARAAGALLLQMRREEGVADAEVNINTVRTAEAIL